MTSAVAEPHYIEIIKLFLDLGPIGLVMILWWSGRQQTEQSLKQYKDDTNELLRQYREDMLEQRKMYENNVELVKRYAELAGDLKEVITLNTQTMTQLVDNVCRRD
ncbi:MAG: hypothetical protein JEZ12_23995 [Desulfobacterium sp.]|nr:hypothetical protein [Desulfobacterium sp.]